MRENFFTLLQKLDETFAELAAASEARANGTFRKPWLQDEREYGALARYEQITEQIKETATYALHLVRGIRVVKSELMDINDVLSPARIEKEGLLYKRLAEYQRLTQQPVPGEALEPEAPAPARESQFELDHPRVPRMAE